MELLKLRPAYQRAGTDEFELSPPPPPDYISGFQSIHSFTSAKSSTQEYSSEYALLANDVVRPNHPSKSRWTIRFEGWRTGASTAAVCALASLIINLVVALWLASKGKNTAILEVYQGNCDTVAQADIWVHLAINVLSTLLLGGSNFCMQCVSAPTRPEINRFHAKGKYLDIGVPSVRNLRAISWSKVALWWTLGLSSVPLHLMYNSAFFKSLVTNDYNVLVARESFVAGDRFNNSWYDEAMARGYTIPGYVNAAQVQADIGNYQRLEPSECLSTYTVPFLNDKRHVVLVVDDSLVDLTYLSLYSGYSSMVNLTNRVEDPLIYQIVLTDDLQNFAWVCQVVPDTPTLLGYKLPGEFLYNAQCPNYYQKWSNQMENFKPFGATLSHCLAETIPERCSYSANIPIISVVIVSNFIKLICMYIVATQLKDTPLITIGDALESFLNDPDPFTKDMCLFNRSQFISTTWGNTNNTNDTKPSPTPKPATRHPIRWKSAATRLRWLTTLFFLLTALLTVLGLFIRSRTSHDPDESPQPIHSTGLGRIDPLTLIEGWDIDQITSPSLQILAAVLVANLPQTILSFLYLHLNGLATSMWLAAEYADFATERKTLRVSSAKGAQRSTHFLQLPYKVALPLMAGSGVLHWLLSQSIFLAVVARYGVTGELVTNVSTATCGYSPLGMVLTMVMGVLLVAGLLGVGWLRMLKGGMPLAGSCSAAISAACHRPVWDVDASLKPVMWGVVKGEGFGREDFAHCSFSSGTVEPVEEGKLYAGVVRRGGKEERKASESRCREPDEEP